MQNNETRDHNTSVRVNSSLLKKFKETVEQREKNRFKKTTISDLLEIAIKEYISKEQAVIHFLSPLLSRENRQ